MNDRGDHPPATAADDPPADPIHLPDPSVWPVVLAGGISLICAGIAVGRIVGLVGAALFAIGLAGWIQEMRHEQRHS